MIKKALIRIGVFLFLFAIGYLVGGGISKTVKYLTEKHQAAHSEMNAISNTLNYS
ncbi:MAG: hypothetical protein MUE99_04920 [Chitinophagaceae bacterium]|nr:hypothetical protein [Chitinophagaceae bacterium]